MGRGFIFGTILGIAISPLLEFASDVFWGWLLPKWGVVMNGWESSLVRSGTIIIAVLILGFIWRWLDKKEKAKEEEKEEEKTTRFINSVNANTNGRMTELTSAINNQTIAILEAIRESRGGQNGQQKPTDKPNV